MTEPGGRCAFSTQLDCSDDPACATTPEIWAHCVVAGMSIALKKGRVPADRLWEGVRGEDVTMKYFLTRRNVLIQPRFQLALTAKAILFLVLYSTALVLLILFPSGLTPEAKRQVLSLPSYTWALILALGVVGAVHVILLSHRVAGPSFRLVRAIRQMATGEYQQPLTLRKHDALKEVAESLAFLGQTLHHRRQALLDELGKLRTRLAELRDGKTASALQQDLESLLEQITVLQRLAEGTDVPGPTEPAKADVGVTPSSAEMPSASGAARR